jgi:hypothetical protein
MKNRSFSHVPGASEAQTVTALAVAQLRAAHKDVAALASFGARPITARRNLTPWDQ